MTNLSHIASILFDVGNTLHHLDLEYIAATVSRLHHPVEVRQVAVAEYAAKRAIDEMFRARAGGDDGSRQLSYYESILAALGVASEKWEEILAALKAENQRASLWRVMHPATPAVLQCLRQRGFTLAVVSNADGRVAAAIAEKGTAHHFQAIIDSHVVGVEKPDPRIFQLAMDACGMAAASTLYVGDIYEIDVRGARAAGLTPVLLDTLDLYGPLDCLKIQTLEELLPLLKES